MIELSARCTRLLLVGLLLLAVLVAVAVLPVPGPLQMRTWAQSVGIAAPLLFLLGHTLVTMAPVPRTVFTLAAGLLFGPVLGVALSLVATVLSAALCCPIWTTSCSGRWMRGCAVVVGFRWRH